MKRYILLLFFLTALSSATTAQVLYDFGNLITGDVKDAQYLTQGYMGPAMKAFGYGMNNGWYNSAAPHKLGGFDLTLTTSFAIAPDGDKNYYVDNTKMTQIERLSGDSGSGGVPQSGNSPTVFGVGGSGTDKPDYRTPKGSPLPSFNGPAGSGLGKLPTPALGLGVGLPLGFELRLRYVPTVDFHKLLPDYTGTFKLFGVGVMHDIKQWIPGIKALPIDISAFVGYTKMTLDAGIDKNDATKRTQLNCQATTIQALVGKKISVLAIYGGLGYNMAKTDLAVKGSYDFSGTTIKDPFTITGNSNGFRGTLGLRLRLAVIAFHADYTFQKYNTFTAGFGINFR